MRYANNLLDYPNLNFGRCFSVQVRLLILILLVSFVFGGTPTRAQMVTGHPFPANACPICETYQIKAREIENKIGRELTSEEKQVASAYIELKNKQKIIEGIENMGDDGMRIIDKIEEVNRGMQYLQVFLADNKDVLKRLGLGAKSTPTVRKVTRPTPVPPTPAPPKRVSLSTGRIFDAMKKRDVNKLFRY